VLDRIRKLHPLTHAALLATAVLFLWLNLDYTRNAYNEHIGQAWNGGMRCGFPVTCWDSGQASSAGVSGDKLLLSMKDYGGVLWHGVVVNSLILCMTLLGVAWSLETARTTLFVPKMETPRTYRRMHPASYASAACMAALLLGVNARFEIQKVEVGGKTDFIQTSGWPLDAYSARKPSKHEYAKARKAESSMLAYLESNPNAWFTKARWNTQNITWNLLICVALVLATAMASEWLFARRRVSAEI